VFFSYKVIQLNGRNINWGHWRAECRGRYLDRIEKTNRTWKSFQIDGFHDLYRRPNVFGLKILKKNYMWRACVVMGESGVADGILGGNLWEGGHS
jgi:hypothetical protein